MRLTCGIFNDASSAAGVDKFCGALPSRIASALAVVLRGFDEGGEGRAKSIDRDPLLRNFETGDAALGKARFDDAENFFGVLEIEFGDADAVVETQDLRIKISDVGGDDQAQSFAIELTGVDSIVGRLSEITVLAPKVHLVADAAPAAHQCGIFRILKRARRRAAGADIRVKRRTGDFRLGARLLDAVQRRFEIEILRQRNIDQAI